MAPPETAGGKKTGPKPSFGRDDVVDCALSQGLDSFMLSDIARSLGVAVPSLYRVIDSRDHIVELALEKISSTFEPPGDDLSWEDLLRHQVDTMIMMLGRYRGVVQTIFFMPGSHAYFQPILRAYRDKLVAAGIPGGSGGAEFALDFVGDTTSMFLLGCEEYLKNLGGGRRAVDLARERLARVDNPVFELTDDWFNRPCLDAKIDVIICGIKTMAQAGKTPSISGFTEDG